MENEKLAKATRTLLPPDNWDDSNGVECVGLDIIDYDIEGSNVMMSKWTPTKDELRQLNDGGSVFLHVWGVYHPPVEIVVEPESIEV